MTANDASAIRYTLSHIPRGAKPGTELSMIPTIIAIVVVIVIVCAIAGIYNNMVTLRKRMDNA